ncbi:RDD family protein [Streptacidiphilus rugosus]|uniref:RDD family protein n=1 Tax=Streptacidiphilus rugosus TaxID=405783 RepID=UPI00068AA16B|nr:RDD family protein [Streptacidiphilus rugosus]
MTVQPPAERPAPGYYPDPSIPGFIRYWDGHVWTPGSARPAPVDGAPMPPPPRAGSRGGVQVAPPPPPRQEVRAMEETGPVFLDETGAAALLVPEAGTAQDGGAARQQERAPSVWGASPDSQHGLLETGSVPRHVSWGVPEPEAAEPAGPVGVAEPAARASVTPGASEADADEELASALRLALTQTRRAQLPPAAHYESPAWPERHTPAASGLPAAPAPGVRPDLDWAADGPAVAEAAPAEPLPAPDTLGGGPAVGLAAGAPQQSGAGWTVRGPMAAAPALRAAERQLQGRAPESVAAPAPKAVADAGAPQWSGLAPAVVAPAVADERSAERPAQSAVPGSTAGSAPAAEASSAARPRLEPHPDWPPRETVEPAPVPAPVPPKPAPAAPTGAVGGSAHRTAPAKPPAPAPAAPLSAAGPRPSGVPTAGLSASSTASASTAPTPGRGGTAPAAGASARSGAGARRQRAPRPALLGPRIGARLIDTVVAYALVGVLGVVLVQRVVTHLQGRIDAARASGLPQTVWLVDWTVLADAGILLGALLAVGVIYEAIPTAVWGRTLGKASLGLVVLDARTRSRPSLGQALLRTALCQTFVFLTVGILELVPCAADRRLRQSWHDRLSRTFVAKR